MRGARRWVVLSIFTLSSSLSFLDRQLLAALAEVIKADFRLSNTEYGYILSAFSLVYAVSAPFAGYWIDRVGLNLGISICVVLWSLASVATGYANGFAGLLGCRAWLGLAESGGLPASGKAAALYLKPQERAVGSAFGQFGISLGTVVAPLLATGLAAAHGWRSAFVVCGLFGFLWIPLWLWTARRFPPDEAPPAGRVGTAARLLLRDRRLYGLMAANVLSLTAYSVWMNWTTVFLVHTRGMAQEQANLRFAWIPPLFASLGGLAGGSLSLRFTRGTGEDLFAARLRACGVSALMMLATAAAPYLPGDTLVTAAVCWSFFWTVAMSVNVYALPLDFFGVERAAMGVSSLTFAYGLMQTVLSPAVGWLVDRYGFGPVCAIIALLPGGAYWIIRWTGRKK